MKYILCLLTLSLFFLIGCDKTTAEPESPKGDAQEQEQQQDTANDTDTEENNDDDAEIDTDEPTSDSGESFTIIVMPDTQHYLKYPSKTSMFFDQVDWIVEQKNEKNIVFVVHLGDMIDSYSRPGVSEGEWEIFVEGMDRLTRNGITYGVVLGNHDYQSGTRNSQMFNDYLPLATFEAMETYGGAFEEGISDNTYHLISAGGHSWLILLLEFGPRNAVVDWANSVISAHPNHLVIGATHGYLNQHNELLASKMRHSPCNGYGLNPDVNNGEDMWEKLFSKHQNMRLVLCGHCGSSATHPGGPDGAGLLSSQGEKGNTVHQMLSNYQYYTFDKSGYIRELQFLFNPPGLKVQSYNPTYERYHTDNQHQFSLDFEY